MPAPLSGTSTRYRLVRITALVLGSLVFLYACEQSRSSMLSDVWGELLLAAGLGVAGIAAAWFEITLSNRTAEQEAEETGQSGEFLLESENRTIRARIAPSGNLVFHGRETSATGPESHEWSWTFRPSTFPAIRAALGGGDGELVELLENIVPHLDRPSRRDPGAWVRTHGIPATYREKGDNPSRATTKLPILKRGLPREVQAGRTAGIPVAAIAEQVAKPAPGPSAVAEPAPHTSGPSPRVRPGQATSRRQVSPASRAAPPEDDDIEDPDLEDLEDDSPSLRARFDRARGLLARAIPQRRTDPDDYDDFHDLDDEYDDEDLEDEFEEDEDEFASVADRPRDRPRADYDDYRDYDVRYEDPPSARSRRGTDAGRRRDAGAGESRGRGDAARNGRAHSANRNGRATTGAGRAVDAGGDRGANRHGSADRSDRAEVRNGRRGGDGAREGRGAAERAGRGATGRTGRGSADRAGRGTADGTGRNTIDRSGRGTSDATRRATRDPTSRGTTDLTRLGTTDPTRRAALDLTGRGTTDPTRRGTTDPTRRGTTERSGRNSVERTGRGATDSDDRGTAEWSRRGAAEQNGLGAVERGNRSGAEAPNDRTGGRSGRADRHNPDRSGRATPGDGIDRLGARPERGARPGRSADAAELPDRASANRRAAGPSRADRRAEFEPEAAPRNGRGPEANRRRLIDDIAGYGPDDSRDEGGHRYLPDPGVEQGRRAADPNRARRAPVDRGPDASRNGIAPGRGVPPQPGAQHDSDPFARIARGNAAAPEPRRPARHDDAPARPANNGRDGVTAFAPRDRPARALPDPRDDYADRRPPTTEGRRAARSRHGFDDDEDDYYDDRTSRPRHSR